MGRELRMIKPGWEHPYEGTYRDGSPRYKSLFAGPYSKDLQNWEFGNAQWDAGLVEKWTPGESTWVPKGEDHLNTTFEEWYGPRPKQDEYMPEWEPGEATKFVMYENTSEGSPISPAFDTPEELATWLAQTGASAFGIMTASYEDWLSTIRRGWSVGMVVTNTGEEKPGVSI